MSFAECEYDRYALVNYVCPSFVYAGNWFDLSKFFYCKLYKNGVAIPIVLCNFCEKIAEAVPDRKGPLEFVCVRLHKFPHAVSRVGLGLNGFPEVEWSVANYSNDIQNNATEEV